MSSLECIFVAMDEIAPQIALLRQMYMGLDKKSRKAFLASIGHKDSHEERPAGNSTRSSAAISRVPTASPKRLSSGPSARTEPGDTGARPADARSYSRGTPCSIMQKSGSIS